MSCLFNSLSKFVNLSPLNLRLAICDYLQTNPVLMDDMSAEAVIESDSDTDLNKYVLIMRNESAMGGAIEIRSFTNIFKINIVVQCMPNNKQIEFINNKHNRTERIIWTGNHYDPV